MEELNQVTEEQQETTQVGEQDTQTEDNGTQQEVKMFTQDEVDKIINQRLSRERKKFEEIIKEHTGSPIERELSKREREVLKRELKIDARGFLEEQGMSIEVLDILDYTDKESCMESLEKITTTIKKAVENEVNNRLRGKGIPKVGQSPMGDTLRKAFGFKN